MNTSRTIENRRAVDKDVDYFNLIYSRRSGLTLNDFVGKFNFNDYWCFKITNVQKIVEEEEFLEFKHSGYVLFNKKLYNAENIIEWINWLQSIGGVQYLSKPTPPFSPKKIIIKK
jgi:hypothetical protein